MNTEIIQAAWNDMAGRRLEFVEAFYDRLFERYPHYRGLFPERMDAQHERMVEMVGALAQFADHIHLLQPYLCNVGFQHRRTGIHADDVDNFKNTFLDTLAVFPTVSDGDAQRRAWQEAFEEVIIPLFDEGLERGRRDQV
ncbi:MAG: globin [Gammaproteobacteria bacterium]|nr:globin [Gammaproteobacteria bacterium]